jgi:ankyrin repeat protein
LAAGAGYHEIVELLIAKGADISKRDYDGFSALKLSMANGHWDVVKHLVKNGADINQKDKDGNTVLIIAAKKRRFGFC